MEVKENLVKNKKKAGLERSFNEIYKEINFQIKSINEQIEDLEKANDFKLNCSPGGISDGYHTFDELYEYRMLYNAALFNSWSREWQYHNKNGNSNFVPENNVHKSKRHFDGEECFGGGWFIVVAILPTGQITNHYEMKDWDLFRIPETEKVLFEFDGHTPQEAAKRLKDFILKKHILKI
mgnify:CR=1 FL=1